jgi:hypothetical protein
MQVHSWQLVRIYQRIMHLVTRVACVGISSMVSYIVICSDTCYIQVFDPLVFEAGCCETAVQRSMHAGAKQDLHHCEPECSMTSASYMNACHESGMHTRTRGTSQP